MRVIHCADVHLDSRMNTHLDAEQARTRKAELLGTFTRMVSYAASHDVAAILIAGDLFDTRNVSARARGTVRDLITTHPTIDFYYLQGNHDEGSFLSGLQELPGNLHLFSEEWTSYSLGESGRVTLTGAELNGENGARLYYALALDTTQCNLVMLHGQESEHAAGDRAEIVHLDALRGKGIDYLALGHIHSYRMERLDGRGVYCYPGCLEGRGFDECGEHGFVLLDINEEKGEIASQFVPFASRRLYTIPVDVTGARTTMEVLSRMREETDRAAYDESSLVKYELVGALDVESVIDLDFLVQQFRDRFYFVRIKDSTHYAVDIESFAHDMSLRGEFIRTVLDREELSIEEQASVIHYGLQALAGEEISG